MLRRVRRKLTSVFAPGVDHRLDRLARDTHAHGQRLKRIQKHCEATAAAVERLAEAIERAERRPREPAAQVPAPGRQKTIALPEEWVGIGMKDPAQARRNLEALARNRHGADATLGQDVHITFPMDRLLQVPHGEFWGQGSGRVIAAATEAIIDAARHFSISVLEEHYGPKISFDQAGYLRATRIRVLALVEELERRGLRSGRILEIGSLWGSFAMPLQRLGFEVTAVDRYGEYASLEAVVELLERTGVEVVKTTRADELSVFERLGQFDAVIAMAVIEHIPHTPRMFLESLRSHVAPGSVLALDTPNLARYWSRHALAEGRSPLMDIKSQYFTQVPYEGHHREYTGPELVWMMQQAGCDDVRLRYVDYNMVQFEEIHRPHVECLIAVLEDPTMADTLLVSGVVRG